MADKKETPNPKPQLKPVSNGGAVTNDKCIAEGCKAKSDRADFCPEHYEWFKEGLITLQGMRAKDFDKKYHNFMAKKRKVA